MKGVSRESNRSPGTGPWALVAATATLSTCVVLTLTLSPEYVLFLEHRLVIRSPVRFGCDG